MKPHPSGPVARRWLYALAWLPYVTAYQAALIANGVAFVPAFENALLTTLPDALLGPLVLRFVRRLPPPEAVHWRTAVQLLLAVAAFVVASTVGWFALVAGWDLATTGAVVDLPQLRLVPWRMINDVLIFLSLAAIAYTSQTAAVARAQTERAARAEALRARAELEAMRNQLNPHFIFNTYHALLGMLRRDPAAAEEALERLGDLLRYSLRVQREGRDEVPLREEWNFVESYLRLEGLRLGERLRFALDAAPDALECLVPSFSVQTLAENAVRHAVAPRAAGGSLTLRASVDDRRLIVEVDDDGAGAGRDPEADHGLGLRLLRERLSALRGDGATLTLGPSSMGGTRATLLVPRRADWEAA